MWDIGIKYRVNISFRIMGAGRGEFDQYIRGL